MFWRGTFLWARTKVLAVYRSSLRNFFRLGSMIPFAATSRPLVALSLPSNMQWESLRLWPDCGRAQVLRSDSCSRTNRSTRRPRPTYRRKRAGHATPGWTRLWSQRRIHKPLKRCAPYWELTAPHSRRRWSPRTLTLEFMDDLVYSWVVLPRCGAWWLLETPRCWWLRGTPFLVSSHRRSGCRRLQLAVA